MIIEYRGAFYDFKNEVDVETCWLLAKNKDTPMANEIISIIQNAKVYGCKYDEKFNPMIETIKPLKIQH